MPFVQFNVGGGATFTTTRDTILKEPASRLAMIIRGLLPCPKDDMTGAYFIDRDPKHFQICLNYLRDGCCVLPSRPEERRELLQEIRFYQLAGFEAWMRGQEVEELSMQAAAAAAYASTSCMGTAAPTGSPVYSTAAPTYFTSSPNQLNKSASMTQPRSPISPGGVGNTSQPASPRGFMQASQYSPAPGTSVATMAAAFSGIGMTSPAATAGDMPLRLGSPLASPTRSYAPTVVDDGFRWTGKYLRNNSRLRDVVTTLLELAHLAPHEALHGGRTCITIAVECDHDKVASLLGATSDYLRGKHQVVRVEGAMGWSFELHIRPSSDPSLFEKYAVAEYVQDNWFVLTAVLKDQYGVLLEEDTSLRPTCVACRRTNLAITMSKLI